MNEIAEGVFVETEFEGVNVGAVVTDDVLIYIDAPTFPRDARFWSTQVERLYPGRLRFLVLTDYNGDRILNSRWLQATLICHKNTAEKINSYDKRYPQKLLDSLYRRIPNEGKDLSNSPVDKASISFSSGLRIQSTTYDILLDYKPGPTSGNLCVQIPENKVMFSGDTIVCDTFPPLSEMCSHSWLNTLESIDRFDLTDVRVIPGRGSITEPSAVNIMAEFIKAMRRAVLEFFRSNQPVDDIGQLSSQFLHFFPRGNLPDEWLSDDITQGLERIYNEYLVADRSVSLDRRT
jgi:glyoxylase-like metal-dependent hydrolase (beta-lactamase superfamily II)